jgi:predicted dehydrogenase
MLPPSEKLNIAHIGVGGRGGAQVGGCSGENTVAMCDVDEERAGDRFKKFPKARRFTDFRRMFDKMEKKIDAVCVSTPDHTHAVAVMAALRRGKHVYCEKPLAHSIYEIRQIMAEARKQKVVTQLGNQGHSFDTIRLFCEWIRDGAIGDVTEIHARCGANHCKINQLHKRGDKEVIPKTLDWDLWQGPAKARPYNPMYLPGSWRGWLPYGSGTIGDWVCHVVDPVFWALDLGAPTTIQAQAKDYDPKKHADTFPDYSIINFSFPAKGKRGPVKLVWRGAKAELPRPEMLEQGRNVVGTGAVVYGTKGAIMYGSHGAGGVRIIPEQKMREYKQPEQTIPRVKGHHNDWLDSIKNGKQAGSNFDFGGPLTEIARLGIIAMQLLGQKLEWNGPAMKFKNNDAANALVNPPSRKGWEL